MAIPRRQTQICTSFDGARIAYAIFGDGPRLVRAPHWLTHLENDWRNTFWRPWLERLTRDYTLLCTDQRGCGLSEREVGELSFESMVRDLEAVVDAAGWERFALYGGSQGSVIALEYAARHPERVSHLVLYGSFARGRLARGTPRDVSELETHLRLIEHGWDGRDPAYRQFFATRFMPDASPEQLESLSAAQPASSSPATTVRIVRALSLVDLRESAPQIRCPTLVIHARGDLAVPFEEGRLLSSLIPGARLVALDSRNHVRLPQDPAWSAFFDALNAFVPPERTPAAPYACAPFTSLTERETEIVERLAQGLDNAQIAAHLALSQKTVRNHVSRIFDKIGVENRGQAIVRAREAGFGQRRP
jgi:pimeloyl-ACP methyl ester carboxylesterase/DNA-binding CsgD family transcriptional regulator